MKNNSLGLRRFGAALLAVCASVFFNSLYADEWIDSYGNVWEYDVTETEPELTVEITSVMPNDDSVPYELTIPASVTWEEEDLEEEKEGEGGEGQKAKDGGEGEGEPEEKKMKKVTAKVTSFAPDTFTDLAFLSAITIPETIAEIPAEAFTGCGRLEYVDIDGEGLETIGDCAFKGCFSLVEFTMPDSVTTLGQGVFSKCYALEEVTFGAGVTEVPGGDDEDAFFYNCKSLDTVNLGENVVEIGSRAFSGCVALEDISLPDSVETIGVEAFDRCESLEFVDFGDNLVEILADAFDGCAKLADLELPDSIQFIGEYAFAGCDALKYVEIPVNRDEAVIWLDEGVFWDCANLKEIVISESVTYIPDFAFDACAQLVYATLSESVEVIGRYAFSECEMLDYIEIPDSVEAIDTGAFYESGLEDVEFGANLRFVLDRVFYGCDELTDVELPDSIEYVGPFAFAACTSLERAEIPTNRDGSSIFLGIGVFSFCSGLESVSFGESVERIPGAGAIATDTEFTSAKETLAALDEGEHALEYYLLTQYDFASGAFFGCASLCEIEWGENIESIGGAAFFGCTSLEGLTLPLKTSSIGDFAFYGCAGLRSARVPGDIDNFGTGAFANCKMLPFIGFESVTMTATPGVTPFLGNDENFAVYANKGSMGWSGVEGDDSEPAMWCGVPLIFGTPCVVTFDPNGGYIDEDYCYTYVDALFGSPIEPFREGFIFDGWYTEPTGGAIILPTDTVPGDITVYAHWSYGEFVSSSDLVASEDPEKTYWYNEGEGVWRSGEIGNSEASRIATVVNGEGTLVFNWKVFSEEGADMLEFYVDDKLMGAISGDVDWEQKTVKIPGNGEHSVEWVYAKDKNSKAGMDCGWISGFEWKPGKTNATEPEGNFEPVPQPEQQQGGNSGSGSGSGSSSGSGSGSGATPSPSGSGSGSGSGTTPAKPSADAGDSEPKLFSAADAASDKDFVGVATTQFSGYVVEPASGKSLGNVTVKLARANAKTGESRVKAQVELSGATKKVNYSGFCNKDGVARLSTSSSTVPMVLEIGENTLTGTIGSDKVYGSRNIFLSKNNADQAAASAVLSKWLGPVNVAWPKGVSTKGGSSKGITVVKFEDAFAWNTLTATVGAKGKVKVAGMLADGTKVSASAQLAVGKDWSAVPVILPKGAATFTIWLKNDGAASKVEGLGDFFDYVGKPNVTNGSETFYVSKTSPLWAKLPGEAMTDYLPSALTFSVVGTKWILPKNGTVSIVRGTSLVDISKTGENPSALKLTYSAKNGTFKGSFKVYSYTPGKAKGTSVKVNGVMIDGFGFGTGVIRGLGSVDVEIH